MKRFLFVVAWLLTGCNSPDVGKISDLKDVTVTLKYAAPRYQLVPVAGPSTWKIDTQTGDTWFCGVAPGIARCVRAAME